MIKNIAITALPAFSCDLLYNMVAYIFLPQALTYDPEIFPVHLSQEQMDIAGAVDATHIACPDQSGKLFIDPFLVPVEKADRT